MSTLTPSITESEELMSSLPGKVVHLRHREQPFAPEKSFYVVGTAHISKKSVDEVAAAIRVLKPQVWRSSLCKPIELAAVGRGLLRAGDLPGAVRRAQAAAHAKLQGAQCLRSCRAPAHCQTPTALLLCSLPAQRRRWRPGGEARARS